MALPVNFVNCSTSTTPNQSINLLHCVAVEPIDVINTVDPTKTEYILNFSMSTLSPVRDIKLKYTTSTLRNNSLAAIKAATAQTTV